MKLEWLLSIASFRGENCSRKSLSRKFAVLVRGTKRLGRRFGINLATSRLHMGETNECVSRIESRSFAPFERLQRAIGSP